MKKNHFISQQFYTNNTVQRDAGGALGAPKDTEGAVKASNDAREAPNKAGDAVEAKMMLAMTLDVQ